MQTPLPTVVRVLQSVDQDLTGFAKTAFADARFEKLTNAFFRSLASGKRIVFSGCGSSGRLSILLEAAYRKYFRFLQNTHPRVYEKVADLSDSVLSIMTGGDYALIRAVENFEDYMVFGRRQARDLLIGRGDTLVGGDGDRRNGLHPRHGHGSGGEAGRRVHADLRADGVDRREIGAVGNGV